MEKIFRIGTLSDELALWRANIVAKQLEHLEFKTEIINVDSLDNNKLDKPVFLKGRSNIFTRKLDTALFNDEIDIAVHNLSEVPIDLPEGIVQVAVLKRGNFNDVLVMKTNEDFFANKTAIIGTDSLRCKSQWLYRYPNHKITEITGSINDQLQKLKEIDLDGAIFSMSGLKRINRSPKDPFKLGWMVPAPGQGTVMISALEKNTDIVNCCKELNDKETEICTTIEREFLHALEEDYSAPIGALATVKEEELKFRGAIFSPDGKNKIEFSKEVPVNHTTDIAQFAAKFLLDRGAKKILREKGDLEKEIQLFSTKNLSIGQQSKLLPNIGITMSDFLTIQYNRLKPAIVKKTITNVVFTNKNAIDSILNSFSSSELDFTNIYCVGRRNKRLIEKNIGKVAHAEKSEEKLVQFLLDNLKINEVTFFGGNEIESDFVNILRENQIDVNKIKCYREIFTPNKIDKNCKAILFYNPVGIESYLTDNTPADQIAFCNGETTAKKAKMHFKKVIIANIPTDESLLDSVNAYFQENSGY